MNPITTLCGDALALQRNAILIELNPNYQPLIQARTQSLQLALPETRPIV